MTSKAFPKGVFNTRTWRRIVWFCWLGDWWRRSKHAQTRNAKETPRISLLGFSMGWGSFRSQVQHFFVICTQLCEMSNVCAKLHFSWKPLRLHIMMKMIKMKVAYCLSDLSRTLPSFWEVTQFSIELHPFSAKLQTTWLTCCAAAMNRTKSIPLFAIVLYSPRKLLSTLPQTRQTCSNQLHNWPTNCVGNAWTFVPPQPVAEDLPPDDSSLPEGACSTLATESLVTSSTPNRAKLHVLRATPTWFPKLVKMSLLFLSMSGGKKCINSLPKKHPCQDALGSKKSHQIKGSTWYHKRWCKD